MTEDEREKTAVFDSNPVGHFVSRAQLHDLRRLYYELGGRVINDDPLIKRFIEWIFDETPM